MHLPILLLLLLGGTAGDRPAVPSERARAVARHAREAYAEAAVALLADLVAFETVAREGVETAEHPEVRAMSAWLAERAGEFGLDFADHGAVVVVGLGDSTERLGLVTHGDVQPADASLWEKSPFVLDVESEPGRLVGRGAEDDKGPIAVALLAMKALRETRTPLARRLELIVSYTEETDWKPFRAFLAEHPPPGLNVAFDASYPAVVAEKGWCSITVRVPADAAVDRDGPRLEELTGGSFLSQVPELAGASFSWLRPEDEQALQAAQRGCPEVELAWNAPNPDSRVSRPTTVEVTGRSAHSSEPEDGVNAIAYLARILGAVEWRPSPAATMVRFVNDLCGTGFHGERFGDLAYADEFMGPLTLSVSTLQRRGDALELGINLRRPRGRSAEQVEESIRAAIDGWRSRTGHAELTYETYVGEPHAVDDAPHVPVLLDVFAHYSGVEDPRPISIGGGTHARLVPHGVNFGPSMPGVPYSGHSEHEFVEREQLALDLEMVTALLVELAAER